MIKKKTGSVVAGLCCFALVLASTTEPCWAQRPDPSAPGTQRARFSHAEDRASYVERANQRAARQKAAARVWARARNLPMRRDDGRRLMELMRIENGKPVYYITHNVEAAISTAADLVRNTSPYNVNGSGITAGIWDAGSVLSNHQEFGSRVSVMDGADSHYHSTHVGGTVGAAGVVAAALGMAPVVNIDSYEWNSDDAEMASRAASIPGESGKLPLSNHSYGSVAGWHDTDWSGNSGWHWPYWNVWGANEEEPLFGQYSSGARSFDEIVYNAPYYLPFVSAGNDRNDNPGEGTTIYYSTDNGTSWNSATYAAASHPDGDGVYDNSGYDTVSSATCAKNILVVGAVGEAVSGGARSPANGTMASFSGWGPTDDGRIKPDIVANGINVYSCDNDNTADYLTLQGTSMSTPNACGSAVLLVEYFDNLFPGQAMRASTLKGLIIHTSDDLPSASPDGPDYKYGWGLMDTQAAADHIKDYAASPANRKVIEGCLTTSNTDDAYTFTWNGADPIRVTLCWTDPPGTSTANHDDTTSVLVNDLDLVVTGPGPTTYSPYILDPANPTDAATTGENNRDNVEQVYIASPGAGDYTVTVDYDGTLTDDAQWYSLLISGGPATASGASPSISSIDPADGGGQVWITVSGSNFQLGANVKLSRSGESDIEAAAEQVSPESITALFDVSSATAGTTWDVVVTNADSQSATLADAFTVIFHGESFETGFGVWTNIGGDDIDWTRTNIATPSSGTGPDTAHDGSWYIYIEASGFALNYPDKTASVQAAFDFTNLLDPELQFRYHMYGMNGNMGTLSVDVYDGAWHSNVWTRTGNDQTSEADPWTGTNVDLSAYEDTNGINIRFRGKTGGWDSDMAIDAIRIVGQAAVTQPRGTMFRFP